MNLNGNWQIKAGEEHGVFSEELSMYVGDLWLTLYKETQEIWIVNKEQ